MRLLRPLRIPIAFVITLTLFGAVFGSDMDSRQTDPASGIQVEGVQIDSVVIENRNIYDTGNDAYDKFIFKLANKLHIKTRAYTVRRELLLRKGDLFSRDLAEESSRNIRQNLKVYDAWIETEMLSNGNLLMKVITVDEWSLTGGINYTREGNETRFKIGAEEENFLGHNQYLSFYYYAQSDDDNFIETRFLEKRLLGRRYRLRLDYVNDPLNTTRRIALSRPFYDLGQKYSFAVDVRQLSGRRDIYDDGLRIGESFFDGDVVESDVLYRWGRYDRKITLEFSHVYRYEHSFDKRILMLDDIDTALALATFPDDSLYHKTGVGVSFADFSYVKLNNIDGFHYTEDYILGYFVGVGYARTFPSNFKGYHFDIAGASVGRYWSNGSNLARLDYGHTVWFKGSEMLRHFTTLRAKYYHRASDRITFAFQSTYTSDWNREGRDNLVIGGTSGLRGYDKFFRTGNRRIVFNAEARIFTDLELLSALFGAAAFVDWGNAWKSDESLTFSDFYAAGGVGLRIGFEKTTKNVVRIDLAYSESSGWELSIGTYQYFAAAR
ncbi:MAG: hypothetical protein JSV52_01830 [Candidatus Zixiibacteriota bacterium]|nr:MAG: hypothetical protein JSV52_01830 [candidate division Zixibacteria bacterium]